MHFSSVLFLWFLLRLMVSVQAVRYPSNYNHHFSQKQVTVTERVYPNKPTFEFQPSFNTFESNGASQQKSQFHEPTKSYDKTPMSSSFAKQFKSSMNDQYLNSKGKQDFHPDNWYKINMIRKSRSILYAIINIIYNIFAPIIRFLNYIFKDVRVYVFDLPLNELSSSYSTERMWVITKNGKRWLLGVALYAPGHEIDEETYDIDLNYAFNFIIDENIFTPKLSMGTKVKIGNKWLAYIRLQRTLFFGNETSQQQ